MELAERWQQGRFCPGTAAREARLLYASWALRSVLEEHFGTGWARACAEAVVEKYVRKLEQLRVPL
eukprot:418649-Alexandrium_andersonii.AAC.1